MSVGELFRHWSYRVFSPGALLHRKYEAFRELLKADATSLERIADIEDIHYGNTKADWTRVTALCDALDVSVAEMVARLREMNPVRWMDLADYAGKVAFYMRMAVSVPEPDLKPPYVMGLDDAYLRSDAAGSKAARLAAVRRNTSLRVPDGFVVTASAFHYVIEYNGLRGQIDTLLQRVDLTDPAGMDALCEQMIRLVSQAELPPRLEADLIEAGEALAPGKELLAVRSSAVAEDGKASFAGQHDSILGVRVPDLPDAYRRVLATKYTPRAITYRIMCGLADTETPMAVLLMRRVDAVTSGVLFSLAPDPPAAIVQAARDAQLADLPPNALAPDTAPHVMGLHHVQGFGDALVSGETSAHTTWLTRGPGIRILAAPCTDNGQTASDDAVCPDPMKDAALLKRIARAGMELEGLFRAPQDVEWVLDTSGHLHIVQTRPVPGTDAPAGTVEPPTAAPPLPSASLVPDQMVADTSTAEAAPTTDATAAATVATPPMARAAHVPDATAAPLGVATPQPTLGSDVASPAHPVADTTLQHTDPLAELPELLSGGEGVAPGVACGTVVHAFSCCDLPDLPTGSVLVTNNLGPSLARLLDRLEGVVALHGSRASHFASVAREFGLPVITGIPDCFERLEPGAMVTVDATHGRVLAGHPSVAPSRRTSARALARRGLMRRLTRAMPHIAKLNLIDPASSDFAPANCRSMHDLVRFCHEMSVTEMFDLVGRDGRGLSGARKVKTDIPVVMYVLNLDDGLFPSAVGRKEISPEDFRSLPLWVLWFGLTSEPNIWNSLPPAADWEALDRLSGGIMPRDTLSLASYAVVSAQYAHVMLRFGYHFTVVDTLCGTTPRENYIQFRFKGGGASAEGREWRQHYLARILAAQGFSYTIRGDLLDARHPAADEIVIQKRLAMLGKLLARARLIDMRLRSEAEAERLADAFLGDIRRASESEAS